MRKNVLSFVLALALTFTALLPINIVRAEAVDEGALNLFLEKLASMDEEKRKDGGTVLREYLRDGDKGIDDLKRDLESIATKSQKESLKNYGYTIDDVKSELDILYSFSQSDRLLLTDYIKSGSTSSIKGLMAKYEGGNGGGTTAAGGGSSQTPTAPTNPPTPPTNGGSNDESTEKLLEVKFKDIEKHPMKEDIVFLAERGIIEGKTIEKFDPNGGLTRAEFVTLMSRVLDLKPKDEKQLPFKDVKQKSWYYDAVKIAYDYKIVDGTSTTTFSPNQKVTREQMAVIVMRILNEKGLTPKLKDTGKKLEMYKDSEKISPWAVVHMSYGVKYGIVEGRDETTMSPGEVANRAEAAQIIKKLYDILNKKDVVGVMKNY